MWVQHYAYEDLPRENGGTYVTLVWNPFLEFPRSFLAKNRGEVGKPRLVYTGHEEAVAPPIVEDVEDGVLPKE